MSGAVTRLLKQYGIGVAHRRAGTLCSRLMTINDRIPSEHSSIIYRDKCKDCTSTYTGQTSRRPATSIKEHWPIIMKCTDKAFLRGFSSQASSWMARLFKGAANNKGASMHWITAGILSTVSDNNVTAKDVAGGEINATYWNFLVNIIICPGDEFKFQLESSTCRLQSNLRIRLITLNPTNHLL